MMITQDRLKQLFEYDNAGLFIRKITTSSNAKAGFRVGSKQSNGYLEVKINNKSYLVHRLIWIFHNGEIIDGMQVDHMNGIRTDNRIENLRCVTCSANNQNQRKATVRNKTGLLGVSKNKYTGKFFAQIQIGKKKLRLGYCDSPEEAHDSYLIAKRKLHEGCTI